MVRTVSPLGNFPTSGSSTVQKSNAEVSRTAERGPQW